MRYAKESHTGVRCRSSRTVGPGGRESHILQVAGRGKLNAQRPSPLRMRASRRSSQGLTECPQRPRRRRPKHLGLGEVARGRVTHEVLSRAGPTDYLFVERLAPFGALARPTMSKECPRLGEEIRRVIGSTASLSRPCFLNSHQVGSQIADVAQAHQPRVRGVPVRVVLGPSEQRQREYAAYEGSSRCSRTRRGCRSNVRCADGLSLSLRSIHRRNLGPPSAGSRRGRVAIAELPRRSRCGRCQPLEQEEQEEEEEHELHPLRKTVRMPGTM